jgi:hypothetical protein
MVKGKKSFINRSYRIHGEPDLVIKDEIRKASKKYGVHLIQDKITDNNGSYNRCDLIDSTKPFIVESDGSWHQTHNGYLKTLRRIKNYSELDIPCGIFDPDLFYYLCKYVQNPYEWYMAPIIQTFNVNRQWGLIL